MTNSHNLIRLAVLVIILLISVSVYASGTNNWLAKYKEFAGPTQTNRYYNAGENTIELAPSLSSSAFFTHGNRSTGISAEYEHWQSLTMGTGIELGSYDIKRGVDHISVMEDYRLVRLPQTFLMGKFALVGKLGAETLFRDGSKNMEIGAGINYNLFEKRFRLEVDYIQHIRLTSPGNGGTVRAGLQILF